MRFTADQYDEAIANLTLAKEQLEPDGNCCSVCGDSDHMAFECGHNPLISMVICNHIAEQSRDLHNTLHYLAGFDFNMCVQRGPARVVSPQPDGGNFDIPQDVA